MPSFISLGRKPESGAIKPADPKKEYFPSTHISGIEGLDVKPGDKVLIEGEVGSCTKGKDGKVSCEIECTGIKYSAKKDPGDGLDSALSAISKKKQESAAEESDEEDAGLDNDQEEADEID